MFLQWPFYNYNYNLFNHICFYITEGDQCDTWYIAAYLSNVASYALSGPFKTKDTYAIMCL